MNKSSFIVFTSTIILILTCNSLKEKSPQLENPIGWWAGNPKNPTLEPFDYYYQTYRSKASAKAIAKKSGAMMQATCTEASNLQGKHHLMRKIIGDTIMNHTYPSGRLHLEPEQEMIQKIEFRKTRNFDFAFNSSQFNTLHLIKSNGKDTSVILDDEARIVQYINLIECKPLGNPNPEKPYIEWEECECLILAYVPGGKEGLAASKYGTYLK